MKHQDIIDFLSGIVQSLGLTIHGENHGLYLDIDGELVPQTLNKKPLILPTYENLKAGDHSKIYFYPMQETASSGESPNLKKFRSLITYRLTEIISLMGKQFLEIYLDSDSHTKLTPQQKEVLKHLNGADKKTLEKYEELMETFSVTGKHMLVRIFLSRQTKLDGVMYSRVGNVSFPILEAIDDFEDKKIFGVTCRVKDQEIFKNLFEYILGANAREPAQYSYGSQDLTAPYFHALTNAFLNVAKKLNKHLKKFGKLVDDTGELLMDLSWEKDMDNLAGFRDLIPSNLEGSVCDNHVAGQEAKGVLEAQAEVEAPKKAKRTAIRNLAASAVDTVDSALAVASEVLEPEPDQVQYREPVQEENNSGTISWRERRQQMEQGLYPQQHNNSGYNHGGYDRGGYDRQYGGGRYDEPRRRTGVPATEMQYGSDGMRTNTPAGPSNYSTYNNNSSYNNNSTYNNHTHHAPPPPRNNLY